MILPLETLHHSLELAEVVLSPTHVEHFVIPPMLQLQELSNLYIHDDDDILLTSVILFL
jgi:hypothetical protein